MKNLFGYDSEYPEIAKKKVLGKYQAWKITNGYRLSDSDEKCKNCKYMITMKYANTYYKCGVMGNSSSSASDIRLKCVCDNFNK